MTLWWIWVQIHSAAQFMDFSVKVTSKRPNTASHDVNDRVRNMVFLDMLAARFQRSNVIIDCLCRSNLRYINFEAVGIVEFKFVVIDLCHALKFALIHAAIAISFAGNMIFDVLFMRLSSKEQKNLQKNKPYKGFSRFRTDLNLVGLTCALYVLFLIMIMLHGHPLCYAAD